jgi:DNA-binding transcriptional MerR regulator
LRNYFYRDAKDVLTVFTDFAILLSMRDLLSTLRGRKFVGIGELLNAAAPVIENIVAGQHKKTVTEIPNERTVRFYINEGLLPPRESMRDQTAVYGYQHLLLLVAVKTLQADGLPIAVIRTLIENKSDDELEELIRDRRPQRNIRPNASPRQMMQDSEPVEEAMLSEPPNPALEYLDSIWFAGRDSIEPPISRPDDDVRRRLSEEVRRRRRPLRTSAFDRSLPDSSAEQWTRYVIEPGLELHVHEGYQQPYDRGEREIISQAIARLLGHLP